MNDHDYLRRHSDYGDMPRAMAWFIMSVRDLGLPAVVIGALLYICFVSQEKLTVALRDVSVTLATLNANDVEILRRMK